MTDRVAKIRSCLDAAFRPVLLDLIDDSASHVGHAGARNGGHYYLTLVSSEFAGLPPVRRHQKVYQALGNLLQGDIHALSMKLYTPDEHVRQHKEPKT